MEITRKSFTFEDGREITVSESTWEASAARARIEEQARADRTRLNGSGDSVFLFFLETFYSYLASCSSGPIPSPEEAFRISETDLDQWYETVVSVNPENFIKVDRAARGSVTFRDGSGLEIVSSFLPSSVMRRVRLEDEALRLEEDKENPKDVFRVYLYPVLGSCSRGDLPSAQEVKSNWPEVEIYKWRDAVSEVNPHLFGSTEEIEKRTAQESKTLEKKRGRSRVKSPPS